EIPQRARERTVGVVNEERLVAGVADDLREVVDVLGQRGGGNLQARERQAAGLELLAVGGVAVARPAEQQRRFVLVGLEPVAPVEGRLAAAGDAVRDGRREVRNADRQRRRRRLRLGDGRRIRGRLVGRRRRRGSRPELRRQQADLRRRARLGRRLL